MTASGPFAQGNAGPGHSKSILCVVFCTEAKEWASNERYTELWEAGHRRRTLHNTVIFRVLVSACVILQIVLLAFPLWDAVWLSDQQAKVLSWSGLGTRLDYPVWLFYVFHIIWFLPALGLLTRAEREARFGMLIWLFAYLVLVPFTGMRVQPPWEAALIDLFHLLLGVVLAWSFLSGVRQPGGNVKEVNVKGGKGVGVN